MTRPPATRQELAQAILAGQTGHHHHNIEDTLRTLGPLHPAMLPSGLQVYVVTAGYEQTRELLAEPRLSKDSTRLSDIMRVQLGQAEVTAMHGPSMLMSDPPQHTRLRKLVASEFTNRRVTALRPRIEQLAADLVGAIPSVGSVDLIRTVAFPLPITVVSELLGVPSADRDVLRGWTEQLMQDDPVITVPASNQMTDYLRQLIEVKRASLGETDLLGALSRKDTDGSQLSPDELIANAMLLIVAGHETTTNLIGNAVYALLSDPDRWRAVADTPALASAAIDETLRWDPPVRHATHRVSTEPLDIAGQILPSGEIALINIGAASRDPLVTRHANVFDMFRPTRHHVTFGYGIHFCLGAALARLEAEICLTQLTSRWRAPQLVNPEPQRSQSAIMNGLQEIMITGSGGDLDVR